MALCSQSFIKISPGGMTKHSQDCSKSRFLFFHGTLIPESGLQQQVAAALTALVAAKGIQPTISAVPKKDEADRDIGVEFLITAPVVEIADVTLNGAGAGWTEPLAAVRKAAIGQAFDDGTQATLEQAIKAVYHRQGYLDLTAAFSHGDPQIADGKVRIPITETITEGAQYRLASLTLSGDVLVSQNDFIKHARIHPGDIANEDLLRETLASVTTPYRTKGYIRAKIQAAPKLDRTAHTVDYAITVVPGPVYTMGKFTIANLDDHQKELLMKCWTLREGDPYDATYPPQVMLKNRAALHDLEGLSAAYKQYEHEDTHIVDLVMTFRKGGPLN